MDVFVDIPGYPGYKVNRLGEILGIKGWLLKPATLKCGYKQVGICLDGNQKNQYVHRLVALAFIPNPENLSQIDHIDNNKINNRVDNLLWITQADNCNRQERRVNAKNYRPHQGGWRVQYKMEGKSHTKAFRNEDDAQFYVSLLKAIYPRF